MKIAYISIAVLLWLAGLLMFVAAMGDDAWNLDDAKIVTCLGMLGVASVTLFSFFWGAQRGHIVRFLGICLFFALCLLIYSNVYLGLSGPKFLALIFIPMLCGIYLLEKFRAEFLEQYKRNGVTNYFNLYFNKSD